MFSLSFDSKKSEVWMLKDFLVGAVSSPRLLVSNCGCGQVANGNLPTCSLLTFPWWCSSSSRPALRERLYALNLDFMVWTINIFIWIWELFLEIFFSILEVFFLQIGSFFFSIWYLDQCSTSTSDFDEIPRDKKSQTFFPRLFGDGCRLLVDAWRYCYFDEFSIFEIFHILMYKLIKFLSSYLNQKEIVKLASPMRAFGDSSEAGSLAAELPSKW